MLSAIIAVSVITGIFLWLRIPEQVLIMLPQLSQKRDLEVIADKIMSIFKQPINLGGQGFYFYKPLSVDEIEVNEWQLFK